MTLARIVLISPYLKGGQNAAKLAQRTRYVATRPGVELLADERSTLPRPKRLLDADAHVNRFGNVFLRRNSQRNILENSSFVRRVVVCVVVAKKEVPQCTTT